MAVVRNVTETYECPEGYARCYGSRQCELEYFFCDEEDDCNMGTDEDPAICSMYTNCILSAQSLGVGGSAHFCSTHCLQTLLNVWFHVQ